MTKKQTTLIALGLLLGVLLEALDSTIVSTAVPQVAASFNQLNLLSWVFAAYMITATVSTPLYGKLSDMYGRMPFYLIGMGLFMLGSIACGASQNMTELIVFRAVQGLGAGAMLPIAIALVQTVFPPEQRGSLQGVISGAYGLASLIGPSLGGWIVDSWNWRWIFYFSIPFGLFGLLLLYINLPESGRRVVRSEEKQTIDYFGAALLVLFATALLLGFQWGSDTSIGWLHIQTLSAFAISIISLTVFILVELRTKQPLIPIHMFRSRNFASIMLCNFLIGATLYTFMIYIPLFLQAVLGTSAAISGNLITPANLALVLGTILAGMTLGRRFQHYKWMALGAAFIMLISSVLLATLNNSSVTWQAAGYMVIFAFGVGITFPLYSIVISVTAEKHLLGVSQGLLTFFRNLGGSISVALFGSILTVRLSNEISAQLAARIPASTLSHMSIDKITTAGSNILTNAQAAYNLRQGLSSVDPSGHLYLEVIDALRVSLSHSINTVFLGGVIVASLTLLASCGLQNMNINLLRKSQDKKVEMISVESSLATNER